MNWSDRLERQLSEQKTKQAYRTRYPVRTLDSRSHIVVDGQVYCQFASNDYLGLANEPSLKRVYEDAAGLGSGSSPMLTGYHEAHALLEAEAAAFFRFPQTLLFSSGYLANVGVLTALLKPGDWIFADRLNHASLNDGCRLSGARLKRFRHHDLNHLIQLMDTAPNSACKLIAVESLYSMDGDLAPLSQLLAIAEAYDALLLVDEAHSIGLFGPQGRGCMAMENLASDRLIMVAPLGKAMGFSGALVAAHPMIIETLIQLSRPYIYDTAMPILQAEILRTALRLIEQGDERRDVLRTNIEYFRQRHSQATLPSTSDLSPIQPYLLGTNEQALFYAQALKEAGLWVPAIRPPTVPFGTARLRISLSATHTKEDIHHLCDLLDQLAPKAG